MLQQARPPNTASILDPLLHVLGHSLEHWPCSDYEHGQRSRSWLCAQHHPEAGVYWFGSLLRLLCHLRPAVESRHVEGQPACVDESDCYMCGHHWDVPDCNERSMESLVSLTHIGVMILT
jgi:hypothetical protein